MDSGYLKPSAIVSLNWSIVDIEIHLMKKIHKHNRNYFLTNFIDEENIACVFDGSPRSCQNLYKYFFVKKYSIKVDTIFNLLFHPEVRK